MREKFVLSIGGVSSRRLFDMLRESEKFRVPVIVEIPK